MVGGGDATRRPDGLRWEIGRIPGMPVEGSTSCCDWYGVDCDSTGRVTGLSIFQDDNLTGTIPPAIADLPYLNNLLLSQLPKLAGPIPSALAGLKNIQLFRIMNTAVSGPVPGFLSTLTTLTIIDLSHNQLTGATAIPSSLANLPNLQALHLDHNRLSGDIPASFGSFSKDSPPDLYLSHNSLTGTIPASLGGPNWGIIDLSWNQIAGDASFLFGSSKSDTQIDLSRNMLSFDLTHVSFPTKLTLLDLSHNKIYGGKDLWRDTTVEGEGKSARWEGSREGDGLRDARGHPARELQSAGVRRHVTSFIAEP